MFDVLDLVADDLESDELLVDEDAADRARYLRDPRAWVREKLGEHLWSKQIAIAESVRDNRQTAVRSCHGVGKSFLASRLAAWWIDSHPPGSARVVTTAPTGPQVQAILWTEINTAAERAVARGNPLLGRINETEWKIGRKLVGLGRKPSNYDPNAFQGIHAQFVLVILDEACGIPKHFWTAAKSMATGHACRILAIGNPDDPGSYFAEVCDTLAWPTIEISAASSPNFTGERVPAKLREVLVSHAYVEGMAHEYGVASPTYISKVDGRFPEDAKDGVVRLSKLKACCRPHETAHPPEALLPVELGVDPGAGGDQAAIRERRGVVVGREWTTHTQDSEELVDLIIEAINETGATAVKVDVIGIGWGIVGSLRRRGSKGEHGAQIIAVNVGEASSNPKRFLRLRSQIWWEVGRGLTEDLVWDLSMLEEEDQDRLISQLTAPKYQLDASRRIVVEKKEETKDRLGRSPDNADALLLAFYGGAGQGSAYLSAMKKTARDQGIEVPETTRNWRNRVPEKTTGTGGRRAAERNAVPGQILPKAIRGRG